MLAVITLDGEVDIYIYLYIHHFLSIKKEWVNEYLEVYSLKHVSFLMHCHVNKYSKRIYFFYLIKY